MQVQIYNFSKRENSTKQPSVSAQWTPEVVLKQPCDMLKPILQLEAAISFSSIISYNYLWMEGNYYFIEQWRSIRNNIWECDCNIDVLATYKSYIINTQAFVEYDTTPNTWIIDHRLSLLETGTRAGVTQNMSLQKTVGEYVLCVTGNNGSVGNFVLSESMLNRLLNSVRDWSDIQVEDTGSDLKDLFLAFCTWATKALSSGSAPNNIRGAVWIPWRIDGSAQTIYLGTYNTGVSAQKITNPIVTGGAIMQIPWQANDWRRCSLCHTFELYLPYCGNVGIDAGILSGSNELVIQWSADMRTGDIQYLVFSEDTNGLPIGSYSGCAGVSVPLGVASVSPLSQLGSVFATGAQITSGNITGAAMGLASTAQNFLVPNMTSIGTQASGAASGFTENERIHLYSLFRNTNVAPDSVSDIMGTPAMMVKSLSSLTGFVKTRGVSVDAPAGKNILDKINGLLDGGVYIE